MLDSVLAHVLLRRTRAPRPQGGRPLRIVDLFAGCGGLTLGIAQAAAENGLRLEIPLAVDFEALATAVYKKNFPFSERVETAPVEGYFDGELGAPHTLAEKRTAAEARDVDVLLGGPPCQGHSNLNNHTRRVDGKNALYLRMVRAAEVLTPRAVLIENVPAVLNDRHDGEGVVERARKHLTALGYAVDDQVVELDKLGVAQTRRRHILLAIRDNDATSPEAVFNAVPLHPRRDLRWAIGDLVDVDATNPIDRAPEAQAANKKRMQYLLDNDLYDLPNALRPHCQQGEHSYKSMYGRLRWNEPAQTITSGFGSIGQGRYMHPERPRALTAHEAARIQGFPDYFDFSPCPTRGALATMIGNAVPPALTASIFGTYLAQTRSAANELGQEAATSG
ncbi:DNA cytosine methyltransferase [Demequina sp. SYSU T00039]|uniref:DNA (cytosine-5-)-methyltransferase n=1 Tax=Demequina lignilytica TaxID=3051663 RepID=A0AAW7M5V5_9MICO|nr:MULTISPECIES: DNA cytosine methyltransferase [unclassified Demequina]MDN4477298.1 DNA cytosine methyltransferase [Demequina sp. SYSU T00039-1]MDN4487471.1 DNA cytosine methyltransferase [Demequina sp. SYSU T00039]